MKRGLQIIWWVVVFCILFSTATVGAFSISGMANAHERPAAVILLLALAGALWAVGKRLMDIVTIERLSD